MKVIKLHHHVNLLNTARKYYADLLARRIAPKADATKPAV
jgi:hypothetical protein